MKTFAVTISKQGTELIEAETEEQAMDIARNMEAEGAFWLDIEVATQEIK